MSGIKHEFVMSDGRKIQVDDDYIYMDGKKYIPDEKGPMGLRCVDTEEKE